MVDKPSDIDPSGSPRPSAGEASRGGGRRSLRSPSEALQPVSAPPPPKPPRRRRPLVATLSGLLSFIGIAAIALAVAWSLGVQRINSAGPLASDRVVTVRPGSDINVVDQLASEGVIDNRFLMTAALWLEGGRGNIKSGEYMFKQAASVREVIDTLVSGKQVLHSVTIPEGLTSEQVVDRLRENDVLVGDISAIPPEGTLMPDTYKFARGTTREQVIRSMQAEQKRTLADVWCHRSTDTPIRSPFELVTLASIVEKETGRADERPRVASVFVNRLTRNMPLQSDPTIVYGLVGGKGTLGRGILKSELEQKTPYNTYTIPGLPPGPIANPGKAALEAVANPSRTKDLYFVADGTGGHAFADNLDQHRLNVLRWRQIEKDTKDRLNTGSDDKGTTGAPAVPHPDQRGDLDVDRVAAGDVAAPASVVSATGAPPIAAAGTSTVTSFGVDQFATVNKTFAAPSAATSTFDDLDVVVAGARSKSDPSTWDDGDGAGLAMAPADPAGRDGEGSNMQTFPVPPAQLAQQRAQAQALGLNTGSDRLPADPAVPANGTAPSSIHLYGKGHIIDASEGTAFDPLRDRSYDLTTAKVVPAIKALPPVQSLAPNVN